MVKYEKLVLRNGLKVIVHEDNSTPLIATNLLYNVGSKDELEDKTGFAHLFEHLMFGGSKHAPDFDSPIQIAGGENNAFTNSDFTNYYITIPAQNIETALWLESDRMQYLLLDQNALDVQRKVVVEEFKETCLNKPYGDIWHHVSALSYTNHPYKWPTIGLDVAHIEDAKMTDVRAFFDSYYNPNNAILVMAGKISSEEGFRLAEKWFGDISPGKANNRLRKKEPAQIEARFKEVKKEVGATALYMTLPMPERMHPDYYTYDLLSDIMSNGRSSRLYRSLHKEQKLFSTIDAYMTGTLDPGLFIIEGRLAENTSEEDAIKSLWVELEKLKNELVPEEELAKIKNQAVSTLEFNEINILSKAMNLAYYESIDDASLINKQLGHYEKVSSEDILRVANDIFIESKCNTLVYGNN